MNIIVIGLGSMGKRRIRLIRKIYKDANVIGVDRREDRRNEVSNLYDIVTYNSIDDVKEDSHYAFVCTSPISHSNIIKKCIDNGMHVFSEINLTSDGYDECIKMANAKQLVLFLSSTFLYRKEIQYIKSRINNTTKWNYIYHIGQYLPDWHPWECYNDYFVSDIRTNACREILAIELPWLLDTFGEVKAISSNANKISKLDLDYNDNFMIQLNHNNGNKGALVVDVVSPYAVRQLEVYSEGYYYSWHGTPDTLSRWNSDTKELEVIQIDGEKTHKDGYSSFITEDAYESEIRDFFSVVRGEKAQQYGFEKDKIVLQLIDSIGA